MYFKYGETELKYLKQKDKKLAEVMEEWGVEKDAALEPSIRIFFLPWYITLSDSRFLRKRRRRYGGE